MPQIWMTAIASFALIDFAAAEIAEASDADVRQQGRAMMVEAQYKLATAMRR